MNKEVNFEQIARQLRKPEGEGAIEVAYMMNEGNRAINQYAIEQLQIQPTDHLLEIGMGNGAFVQGLMEKNTSTCYTGLDYAPEMVREAIRLNSEFIKAGRASFVEGSADRLPFGDKTFTKAFTVNTLYFWEDPSVVLTEIKRVLRPDGLVLIAIRPQRIMKEYPFTPFGFRLYGTEELSDLLVENGYVVTEIMEKEEPDFITPDGGRMPVASILITAVKQ